MLVCRYLWLGDKTLPRGHCRELLHAVLVLLRYEEVRGTEHAAALVAAAHDRILQEVTHLQVRIVWQMFVCIKG